MRELKASAIGTASEVVGGQRLLSFRVKDFRAHKMMDLESVDLLTEAIESLKIGAKTGSDGGSTAETVRKYGRV